VLSHTFNRPEATREGEKVLHEHNPPRKKKKIKGCRSHQVNVACTVSPGGKKKKRGTPIRISLNNTKRREKYGRVARRPCTEETVQRHSLVSATSRFGGRERKGYRRGCCWGNLCSKTPPPPFFFSVVPVFAPPGKQSGCLKNPRFVMLSFQEKGGK